MTDETTEAMRLNNLHGNILIQWQRKDVNLGNLATIAVLKHFSRDGSYKPAHDNVHICGGTGWFSSLSGNMTRLRDTKGVGTHPLNAAF